VFETYGARRKMVMGSRNVAIDRKITKRIGETGIGSLGGDTVTGDSCVFWKMALRNWR
jgi:hypothetical protein